MKNPGYDLRLFLLFLLPATLIGCAGINPVVAPAPIAEIPSQFSIPDSVGVDVSLANTENSLGMVAGFKAGSLGGEFSDAIAFGPDTAAENDETLEGFLFPFAQFTIPVDPNTTRFEGVVEGENQSFKFDFSDYDFDGDGSPDGFTGCTCPIGCAPEVSVCPQEVPESELRRVGFRIWIKRDTNEPFQRVMAGFFNVLPVKDDPLTAQNEENSGSGSFRIAGFGGNADPVSGERFLVAVIYNHSDPANDLNETAESFMIHDLSTSGMEVDFSDKLHFFVSQLGKRDPSGKSYLEKTVKTRFDSFVAAGFEGSEELNSLEAYTGRFRDDADFWSGSLLRESNGVPTEPPIPATCARISTGDGVIPDICIDLAIDTSNEDVTKGQGLSITTEGDVNLPTDFPATPGF